MSRGPSPAFSVPPAMSSSASYNPLLNPTLRVDTEAHSLTTRLRSKSTAQPASRESPTCPIHQVSRSFSHVSPNSASPASAAKDVSLAVNGLRDQPNGSGGSAEDDASGLTMRRIHEALGRSGDEGDTLDLSRRGIEVIGVDAVEIFRKGVGKDHKGVWR